MGTRSFAAAAFASSTVTPRGCPVAGSRVARNVDAAGPTATATRSDPVGAMSRVEESSSAATTEPVGLISRASAVSDRYAALEMFLFMNLEIRVVGLRKREQVLVENILVVLGAHGFKERVLHLAPALHHVKRFVEGVGILDDHVGFKRIAVRGQLEALDHVCSFSVCGVRRLSM